MKAFLFAFATLLASAAMACPDGSFCAGTRVVNAADELGTVKASYSNGKVAVVIDGYSSHTIFSAAELGRGVRCIRNTCVGDRVVNSADELGTVREMFANGKVAVVIDGYSSATIFSIRELGRGVSNLRQFVINDRVVNAADEMGRIREMFSNGKVAVVIDGYSSATIFSVHELGKGYRCIDFVCVGAGAINTADETGTITALFDNGRAAVRIDGYSSSTLFSFDELGLRLTCRLRDNCVCK